MDHQKTCKLVYSLYLVSLLSLYPQIIVATLGMVAGIAGIILAYRHRASVKDTPYASHVRFQIRTFWLGGGALLPIATVVAAGIIFVFADMSSVYSAMSTMEMGVLDVAKAVEEYLMTNRKLMFWSTFCSFGPIIAWFLWRCLRGLQLLKAGQAVPNPDTWF